MFRTALFDGGLAFGSDGAVGQLGVLVTDLRVREVPVAGTARVYDLGGASGPVVEGQRTWVVSRSSIGRLS